MSIQKSVADSDDMFETCSEDSPDEQANQQTFQE